jgi:hypothetical protein
LLTSNGQNHTLTRMSRCEGKAGAVEISRCARLGPGHPAVGRNRVFAQLRLRPVRLAFLLVLTLAGLLTSTGCASRPSARGTGAQQHAAELRERLLQLDASVQPDEAGLMAKTAVEEAAMLAVKYQAVRPAWLHNWLVNAGWRERGLCYEWANDLFPSLHALGLRSLELHLAVARMDTRREHNCIIVTARRQPVAAGLVLDAWRHSGRLWYGDVRTDKYPWKPLPPDRIAPELRGIMDR